MCLLAQELSCLHTMRALSSVVYYDRGNTCQLGQISNCEKYIFYPFYTS